ncbi:MAG TPA: N-acetylglucosamine-6-phosphate deacetylase, partial [Marisediminicola sp.]|nr:N-acetylglucosamine-6-phosphate deacetylase [Marisediminicola sp.]
MSTLIGNARKIDAGGEVPGFWMLVEGDSIVRTGTGAAPLADETVDAGGRRLVPGFIDLHCHGGGGHAYDDGPEEVIAALETHRAHGTTRSVISLVANPFAQLRSSLELVAGLVE